MEQTTLAQPLVSVITPSYYSEHLFEAIDSVLMQSYPNIQYIISDDGTNGFSVSKVREYIHENSRGNLMECFVLHEQENQGTTKNMNKALSYAKGDYIVILAGDDLFYDNHVIKNWVYYFQQTGFLFATSYRAVYDEEMRQYIETLPCEKQVKEIKEDNTTELFELLAYKNFIFGCSTAYTRKFWDLLGGFDESYRLIDDYPMALHALRENIQIGFMDQVTIKYRTGGVSFPKNYSPVYKKDTELIYKREILPYSKKPMVHRMALVYWQWNHKNTQSFLEGYEFCKSFPVFWVLLGIRHPIRAIKKIKRTIVREERKCR